tara:strand:- start:160 stop:693 length:534 start_codon:yes stop_codon:yes gene_type:complete
MFYIYLFIKIILYLGLPIYSLRLTNLNSFINAKNLSLLIWLFLAAFITYIPFYDYYQNNEVNIQYLIPNYANYILIVLFLVLPILYFYFFEKLILSFRKSVIFIGFLFLICSSIIIFGIETYNHIQRLPLEKFCYDHHNASKLMLECCLNAEYIWKEGFSFFNEPPKECEQFMNWND